jgi:hypothetical protein
VPHLRRNRDIDVEPGKEIGGPFKHERPVDAAALSGLLPDEDILGNCQIGEERWVLMHHCNAVMATLERRTERDRLTVLQNRPRARLMNAPDDLDQGALASAVLAGERVHPASKKLQADLGQDLDGSEALADLSQFEDRKHDLVFERRSGFQSVEGLGAGDAGAEIS